MRGSSGRMCSVRRPNFKKSPASRVTTSAPRSQSMYTKRRTVGHHRASDNVFRRYASEKAATEFANRPLSAATVRAIADNPGRPPSHTAIQQPRPLPRTPTKDIVPRVRLTNEERLGETSPSSSHDEQQDERVRELQQQLKEQLSASCSRRAQAAQGAHAACGDRHRVEIYCESSCASNRRLMRRQFSEKCSESIIRCWSAHWRRKSRRRRGVRCLTMVMRWMCRTVHRTRAQEAAAVSCAASWRRGTRVGCIAARA